MDERGPTKSSQAALRFRSSPCFCSAQLTDDAVVALPAAGPTAGGSGPRIRRAGGLSAPGQSRARHRPHRIPHRLPACSLGHCMHAAGSPPLTCSAGASRPGWPSGWRPPTAQSSTTPAAAGGGRGGQQGRVAGWRGWEIRQLAGRHSRQWASFRRKAMSGNN